MGGSAKFTDDGTSYAAPHVAGAALLFMDYGINDPRSIKAILINTAEDQVHSSDPAGWDRAYGWGYLNLTKAYNNRNNSFLMNVYPKGQSADTYWFKGYMNPGDQATLVWHRHASYNGSSYPTAYASQLNDIDLHLFDYTNNTIGSLIDSSASSIDNVEQVEMTWSYRQVIIMVRAWDTSFSFVSYERVGLATPSGFTQVFNP